MWNAAIVDSLVRRIQQRPQPPNDRMMSRSSWSEDMIEPACSNSEARRGRHKLLSLAPPRSVALEAVIKIGRRID